ncbi:MAG: serine/threonine-protein kinase [Bradymonadia bacterium]
MQSPQSQSIGPYRVIGTIAQGGMGEVFLAALHREGGFQKRVALKRALPALAKDPGFLVRFEAEARNAALLTHRHIVQVFDFGRHEGTAWLAMEYVHGVDLKAVFDRLGGAPLPPAFCIEVGVACARALHYAHRARDAAGRPLGLVHRDVSPQNVLVSFEGDIKLADFGLALIAEDATRAPGAIMGKYAYMSPEQAAGLPVDGRSDAFSLGIVVYEGLTGKRCFYGDDGPMAILDRVLAARPLVAPAESGLHPALVEFLNRALARSPDDRPADLEAFHEALRAAATRAGIRPDESSLGGWLTALFPERARALHDDRPLSTTGGPEVAWESTLAAALPASAASPFEVTDAPAAPVDPPAVTPPAPAPAEVVARPAPPRARRGLFPFVAVLAVALAAGLWGLWGDRQAEVDTEPSADSTPAPGSTAGTAAPASSAAAPTRAPAPPTIATSTAAVPSPAPASQGRPSPRARVAPTPPPPSTAPVSAPALTPSSAPPPPPPVSVAAAPSSAPRALEAPARGPTVRVVAEGGARVRESGGAEHRTARVLHDGAVLLHVVGGAGPPVNLRVFVSGNIVRAHVAARPWGTVVLDGLALGETPLADLALRPGAHRLAVTGPDGQTTDLVVHLEGAAP